MLISVLAVGCRSQEIALLDLVPEAKTDFDEARFPSFRDERRWVDEISLEDGAKTALTPPLPSRVTFSTKVPPNGQLAVAVAVASSGVVKRGRVAFQINLEVDGERVDLHREAIRAPHSNRWHDVRVDLGAWSGRTVRLVFETRPARGRLHPLWADRIRVAWGEPVLETRATASSVSGRPSFVFLLVDTLRADYLGAYGFEGEISPAIDRLAMESLVFESSFTNAPWTKPAVASLFTSLHPDVHGVSSIGSKTWTGSGDETEVLPEEASTLAESLHGNGYETAAFVANPWVSPRHGFTQGFGVFEHHDETDDLLTAAAAWLGERSQKPFFLYLHFMDVHGPYDVPRSTFEAMLDNSSLREDDRLDESDYQRIPTYLKRTTWASDEERLSLRAWRAKYAAAVKGFDRRIRSFLDGLRSSSVLDHSYLILTSDHGEELMEHGGWDHGYNLFEHQLHVPLLIRKPLAEQAGRRLESLVSFIDLMPTILYLAETQPPPGIQGRDFSRLLQQDTPADRPVVFAAGVKNKPAFYSVRTHQSKLVWDSLKDDSQLYDLTRDGEELRDISGDDPALVESLRTHLWEHLAAIEARGQLSPQKVPLTEELRRRLESLGYIQ